MSVRCPPDCPKYRHDRHPQIMWDDIPYPNSITCRYHDTNECHYLLERVVDGGPTRRERIFLSAIWFKWYPAILTLVMIGLLQLVYWMLK
jgi:hypothetical protein